jgi:hypothetical protein
MQHPLSRGLTLAALLALGVAACNGTENASNPPPDEPAQTGSISADPAAPPAETDPAATPPPPATDPAAPAEEPAAQ